MFFKPKYFLATSVILGASGIAAVGCLPAPDYNPYPSKIELGTFDGAASKTILGTGNASALADNPIPEHPFMAPNGTNGTHGDVFASGTYSAAGPTGANTTVNTAIPTDFWRDQQPLALVGECLTQTFNPSGTILYSLCADNNVFKLFAMDVTDNFKRVGVLSMPNRANIGEPLAEQAQDSSGGVYMHIMDDGNGTQVLTTNGNEHIQIITPSGRADPDTGADYGFTIAEDYNVKPFLLDPSNTYPTGSKITDVMLDWNDNNLIWFLAKDGGVGIVDRTDGSVKIIQLTHIDPDDGISTVYEESQNSIAIDENGLYVVSDYAMYRLVVGANNTPEVDWRTEYDRTGGLIAGTFSAGSGTTPTAFGPDYVAITDYSNPIKVVVYSRNTGQEVCNQEVFDLDASATENSLIGYYNTSSSTGSIVVENNYGYSLEIDPLDTLPVNRSAPGVARIDVSGGPGTGNCTLVWDKDIESPSSILKLSTGSGLIYIYEPEYMDNNGNGITTGNEMAWYLTGLNFATGEPEFRTFIGTGKQFNVHYAAITIGPDGTAYAGVLRGLVSVKD